MTIFVLNKQIKMKTGRIQIIEQKLDTIDSAAFQNLCDMYLNLREGAFTSFNRTGSQIGKQKTVKGTPDTFFRLANGNLQYVEFTTKAKKGIVKKIKEDIDKCISPKLTGIPVSSVNKILLCFNSQYYGQFSILKSIYVFYFIIYFNTLNCPAYFP